MPPKKTRPDGKRARTIYLPESLDRRLRGYAAEKDRTISDVVADAVAAFLLKKRVLGDPL